MSLLAKETTFDQKMTTLESEVIQRAKEVRHDGAGQKGNMLNLGKNTDASITARQDYLREKYRDDDTRLTRLYDDESARKRASRAIPSSSAPPPRESLVSFYTDGTRAEHQQL
jgi:hypothetical protein